MWHSLGMGSGMSVSFLVAQGKRRIDEEKPWLDDPGYKELVKERGSLYSRKLRGWERGRDWPK